MEGGREGGRGIRQYYIPVIISTQVDRKAITTPVMALDGDGEGEGGITCKSHDCYYGNTLSQLFDLHTMRTSTPSPSVQSASSPA